MPDFVIGVIAGNIAILPAVICAGSNSDIRIRSNLICIGYSDGCVSFQTCLTDSDFFVAGQIDITYRLSIVLYIHTIFQSATNPVVLNLRRAGHSECAVCVYIHTATAIPGNIIAGDLSAGHLESTFHIHTGTFVGAVACDLTTGHIEGTVTISIYAAIIVSGNSAARHVEGNISIHIYTAGAVASDLTASHVEDSTEAGIGGHAPQHRYTSVLVFTDNAAIDIVDSILAIRAFFSHSILVVGDLTTIHVKIAVPVHAISLTADSATIHIKAAFTADIHTCTVVIII